MHTKLKISRLKGRRSHPTPWSQTLHYSFLNHFYSIATTISGCLINIVANCKNFEKFVHIYKKNDSKMVFSEEDKALMQMEMVVGKMSLEMEALMEMVVAIE